MITESMFLYYYLLATPKHRMDAATLYTGLTSELEVYNSEGNVLLSSRNFFPHVSTGSILKMHNLKHFLFYRK